MCLSGYEVCYRGGQGKANRGLEIAQDKLPLGSGQCGIRTLCSH